MTTLRNFISTLVIGAGIMLSAGAYASDNPAMDAEVSHIDNEWARIKWQVKDKDEQLRELKALAQQAAAVVDRYPGRAEPLLWEGIVKSEEASIASMFDQLGLAKAAKALFEQAEKIDPQALDGAVTMSLGVIYYRVPGFPLGFGDDGIARHYLEAAIEMNPNGLDGNYFYGDFLIEQGEYKEAKAVLEHALKAPADPNRPVWDSNRRAEIQALIAKADAHLGG
jgi:tetratricopeptide (TPR) repeat protein